ncbi:MAG: cyclic-phosphate processing receiver domain-containing protein [Planctomycetota bacterium]
MNNSASNRFILMLEDDNDRLARFNTVLSDIDGLKFENWKTADGFIGGYSRCVDGALPDLICLDHDLFPENEADPDPGDGRDVAEYLATQAPNCHVVIHSSNAVAADSMFFTLEDAGWSVEKIAPLGRRWVEDYWWPTIQRWLDK